MRTIQHEFATPGRSHAERLHLLRRVGHRVILDPVVHGRGTSPDISPAPRDRLRNVLINMTEWV
jgi:hypothetical protein